MTTDENEAKTAPLPDLGLPLIYDNLPEGTDQVTLEGNVSRETKEKA